MQTTKEYFLHNFAPALGVMFVCLLGSFVVYKGFYGGHSPAVIDLTQMEPAAGEDVIYENGAAYIPIELENIEFWPPAAAIEEAEAQ